MKRIEVAPRPNWQVLVAEQGLVYEATHDDAGNVTGHYWNDGAVYEFELGEVTTLEAVTETLHTMSLEAGRFLLSENLSGRPTPFGLGVPREAVEYAQASLDRADPSLYGRFDLVWEGPDAGPAKLLEYNADTPTGLVEAALCQWYRHESDWLPHGYDQWNSLHESLVGRWQRVRSELGMHQLHLGWTDADESGEDLMTITYLADTAAQAGWRTELIEMRDIGLGGTSGRFTDANDHYLEAIFKLYPWEDMVAEDFGRAICASRPRGWIEPAWKMALGTKMLLAALWYLYPGHDNLLACYPDGPRHLAQWVSKPLHSREGANVEINSIEFQTMTGGGWGEEPRVWQDYAALPDFRGSDGSHNRPVLGTWIIGDECCGVGIRESDGPVTDASCRFVANRIAPQA